MNCMQRMCQYGTYTVCMLCVVCRILLCRGKSRVGREYPGPGVSVSVSGRTGAKAGWGRSSRNQVCRMFQVRAWPHPGGCFSTWGNGSGHSVVMAVVPWGTGLGGSSDFLYGHDHIKEGDTHGSGQTGSSFGYGRKMSLKGAGQCVMSVQG